MKKYLIIIALNLLSLSLWGQADAGPDVVICNETPVQIGVETSDTYNKCFKWSPETGLEDPNSPTTMANPASTTTYTLTVIDENFNTTTDEVEVKVSVGEITFAPDYLLTIVENPPYSATVAEVSYLETGETLTWSIEGNNLTANIYPNIDTKEAVIAAGNQSGTITVKATASPSGCSTSKSLDIGAVANVTATDKTPQGSAPRVANAGDTLHLVVVNAEDKKAKIEAIPTASSFPPTYPKWTEAGGFPADIAAGMTSFLTSSDSENETYHTGNKNVKIKRHVQESIDVTYDLIPASLKEKLEEGLSFNVGSTGKFEIGFESNVEGSRKKVEKYGSPGYGYKETFGFNFRVGVTGEITSPPPYGGEYNVPFIPGTSVKYGLYARADLGINLQGELANDPSKPNNKWSVINSTGLSATATGTIWVGINVVAETEWFVVKGDLNVSTGIEAGVELDDCEVVAKANWEGLMGNALVKVAASDPNDPFFEFNISATFIDGKDLGSTVIMNLCEE